MKKFLVIAAVAALATNAQAATQKAPVKSTATTKSSADAKATAAATSSLKPASPVSAATGSSTLTTDAQEDAKAGKKWSGSVVTQVSMKAADANYLNAEGRSFDSINYAGVGYKIDAANSVGLRQYFTTSHAFEPGKPTKDSVTLIDPVATYTHKAGKFLGSEPVSPMFWYYIPVSQASRDLSSAGKLRMDAEFNWVLTPKWSVSYYLNPRQSFIQDQTTIADGKEIEVFAKSTLIHYAVLYYSFTDNFQAYTFGGFSHVFRTGTGTLVDESRLAAVGLNWSLMGGKIILNPEIDAEFKTVTGGYNVADNGGRITDEANISYVMTGALTF